MFRALFDTLDLQSNVPNKFTKYLGEHLKAAREQKGMSQAELAEIVYRRRPSISDMENGKMNPDLLTMLLVAHVLEKPLEYFIHPSVKPRTKGKLSELEQEMVIQFRRLGTEDQKLAIQQIRALADFSNSEDDTA